MNAVLFAVGWFLVIFAGVPAVLVIIQGGENFWFLVIGAVIGVLLLVGRSRRIKEDQTEG
ncbi:MAG: hypothetical protein M5U23_02540 [Acidimicrobiia bacterium]|nr:hypothetical protein [Acidimicrobiia bacterium]